MVEKLILNKFGKMYGDILYKPFAPFNISQTAILDLTKIRVLILFFKFEYKKYYKYFMNIIIRQTFGGGNGY